MRTSFDLNRGRIHPSGSRQAGLKHFLNKPAGQRETKKLPRFERWDLNYPIRKYEDQTQETPMANEPCGKKTYFWLVNRPSGIYNILQNSLILGYALVSLPHATSIISRLSVSAQVSTAPAYLPHMIQQNKTTIDHDCWSPLIMENELTLAIFRSPSSAAQMTNPKH